MVAQNYQPLRVLFVASEIAPWSKTGGLGDVAAALPPALLKQGCDIRVLAPWYACHYDPAARLPLVGKGHGYRIVEDSLPPYGIPVWLLENSAFTERTGHPYMDASGQEWSDNPGRFNLLSRAAIALASGCITPAWKADIIHCNDWQTGLVPVWGMLERCSASVIFTIHNLAYQGLSGHDWLNWLALPPWLWHPEALEHHHYLSQLKAGIKFSHHVTTVSPSYAHEICGPEAGMGMDGVLRSRSDSLTGITNGIDDQVWNPATDPCIPHHYDADDLSGKFLAKTALQQEFGLPHRANIPLIAFIGRLVYQKGIDLLLDAITDYLKRDMVQLVVLGAGGWFYEHRLREMSFHFSKRMAIRTGYDEPLAHRIEAGADFFAMPSRFEPCGLNQLYSLRYGTLPIAAQCGGLKDTVSDINLVPSATGATDSGNGFTFPPGDTGSLHHAIGRALHLYEQTERWQLRARSAMREDHSWKSSAHAYYQLYQAIRENRCHQTRWVPSI